MNAPRVLIGGVGGGTAGAIVAFVGGIEVGCSGSNSGNCGLLGVVLAVPLGSVGFLAGSFWAVVIPYGRRHRSLSNSDAVLIVALGAIGGVRGGFAPLWTPQWCFLGLCGLLRHFAAALTGLLVGSLGAFGIVHLGRRRSRRDSHPDRD